MTLRAKAVGLAGLVCALLASPARAGLVATYQFQNSLAADEAGVPALTAVNPGSFATDTVFGQSRYVYRRGSSSNLPADQSILSLDTTSLALPHSNYSVELVFRFTDSLDPRAPGIDFRRVVNGNDGENGLYVGSRSGPSGLIVDDYVGGSQTGGPMIVDGTYYHLVLTVSSSGESVYVDGGLAVSINSTPNALNSNVLNFFLDNSFEYGNGDVALIRLYDSALTARQAAALYNGGNPFPAAVPEPASVVLAGLGGLALLVGVRPRAARRPPLS